MRCSSGAALTLALVAVTGCAGPDIAAKPPTTTTATTVFAEPQSAPVPVPAVPATVAPAPTEQPVATTIPIGLPSSLGIPPADVVTLGQGSTMSNGLTVRGVPLEEVQAFVVAELARLGWSVLEPVAEPDGDWRVAFTGPGAAGTVVLETESSDLIAVFVQLGAPST